MKVRKLDADVTARIVLEVVRYREKPSRGGRGVD